MWNYTRIHCMLKRKKSNYIFSIFCLKEKKELVLIAFFIKVAIILNYCRAKIQR